LARIFRDITETIGNTPLVQLNRVTGDSGATVLAKLECFNPLASVKDRIALSMIQAHDPCGAYQRQHRDWARVCECR
jgi:cysteine synthase A